MVRRLTTLYPIGQPVQIYFKQIDAWLDGLVVAHAHPAVWVETGNGQRWFVTNTRKIRLRPTATHGESHL